MQKYKFQFESIKLVKEKLEKKAQKEVAKIDIEINNLKKKYSELEEQKKKFKNQDKKSYRASELQFQNGYMELTDKILEDIQREIEEMLMIREEKVKDLVQKSKEHKMFETLDENYKVVFRQEQDKTESGEIDEIAISKFIRKEK
jgi:flagellar export protein FliJ